MANTRVSMRKSREVLRLAWARRISQEKTAQSCGVAKSTVWEILNRARKAGITKWEDAEVLSDEQLEAKLFPAEDEKTKRPLPEWHIVHAELKRKGVTRQLLWEEYRTEYGEKALSFTQFCHHYRDWCKSIDYSMRHEHVAGEKLFVDFAGQTVEIVNKETGEVTSAHIFVAVLGASNYTFACAVPDETRTSWLECHIKAFEFFGGAPELVVPDNPKALVHKACRYEPDVNPAYTELARHYGTAVLPARAAKPRDKAKVENAVLIVERWILASLRNRRFFSIAELNAEIARLLEQLNARAFKKLPGSRKEMFETLDRPALKPLPETRFVLSNWKQAKVNIDYHIELDGHYYSVPCKHTRETVDVRFTNSTVEIFVKGVRVASHARSNKKGKHTTVKAHMPKSHREYADWTPERILDWARKVGPATRALVEGILESRDHPAQGFRSALGVLRLSKEHGTVVLENACLKALKMQSFSYRVVRSILDRGLAATPAVLSKNSAPSNETHENIRGPSAYSDTQLN